MSSCDKENVNNNNNIDIIAIDDNMAQIEEDVFTLTSSVDFDDYGRAIFTAHSASKRFSDFSLTAGIPWGTIGKTINLSDLQDSDNFELFIQFFDPENNTDFFIRQIVSNGHLDAGVDALVFASGTLTTTRTEGGYTLEVEGTLTNGIYLHVKLNTPYTDEIIILSDNSLIYDGVKYELTVNASEITDTDFYLAATGENNVSFSGRFQWPSPGDYLNLPAGIPPEEFATSIDFSVNVPGLQLHYELNTTREYGTVNGEGTTTPFTDGSLIWGIFGDKEGMFFQIIGTLSNGKVLKILIVKYV